MISSTIPRPVLGQRSHRLVLGFRSEPVALTNGLVALAEDRQALTLEAVYRPARSECGGALWTLNLALPDGFHVTSFYSHSLPQVVRRVRQPAMAGQNLEPEVIKAEAAWIKANATIRVIGIYLEGERQDLALYSRGLVRDGFVVLELDGAAFEEWLVPTRRKETTHPVFHRGQILGCAGTERGADRLVKLEKPEHGWALKDTPLGRTWVARSADNVAHRLREVRRLALPLAEACEQLRSLDLSDEPELVRNLAEILTALGRGGQADRITRIAGLSVPRRERRTT